MAAPGLPLGAMIGQGQQALLAQQHIAARAAGAGQQVQRNMAAGGTAALVARQPAGLQDAAAAAAEANKRLAAKKRKAAEKPVPEKVSHGVFQAVAVSKPLHILPGQGLPYRLVSLQQ